MGSGLSMASVNKIKELAAQREYSLALDIIDSQDLSKSLNPQFLKLCGEIFIKSRRYADARNVLVRAHSMAPEAKRIIFSLIDLYTKMGYKELVDKYYEIYMYDADEESIDTKQVKYIYEKYNGARIEKLREYIIPYYTDNMDYFWSFEAYLLLVLNDDEDDEELLKALIDEYSATFKNSDNLKMMDSIKDDKSIASSKFYNFNKEIVADDEVGQKIIRREEKKQLEVDFDRIHPAEATIIEVIDEEEKKSKGFFKRKHNEEEQNSESEEGNTEEAGAINSDNDTSDEKTAESSSENKAASGDNTSDKKASDDKNDVSDDIEQEQSKKFAGFFKKLFSKNKDSDSDNNTEQNQEEAKEETTENEAEAKQEAVQEAEAEEVKSEAAETETEAVQEAEAEEVKSEAAKTETEAVQEAEAEEVKSEAAKTEAESVQEADVEYIEPSEEQEKNIKDEDNKMQGSGQSIDINNEDDFSEEDFDEFSEEDFDEFAAESETIEELSEKENRIENTQNETSVSSETGNKSGVLFEDVDISFDDEEEDYEIDDFSDSKHDEFGVMSEGVEEFEEVESESESEAEEIIEEVEPEPEPEPEPEVEEIIEEVEPEPEVEAEEIVEEVESEPEPEPEAEEIVEEVEPEPEPEVEEIIEEVEPEPEPEAEEIIEEEVESEPEPEEIEEEIEPEPEEEEIEEKIEPEPEQEAEIEETEEVFETEPENDTDNNQSEEQTDYSEEDISELYRLEREKIKQENKEKKLDFPVFRSSLFPNYHNDVPEVENNFNEIMNDSKNKIDENFEKEARLQRETEALLASLGISIGGSSETKSFEAKKTVEKEIKQEVFKEEGNKVSRKELKESLKIDSDKKNILRKMKEYR